MAKKKEVKVQPEAELETKKEETKTEETKQPEAPVTLSKAEKMKEHLDKQPKVRIIIPLDSNEKKGATESVILNGYPFFIEKGVYVDVPQQVADVIMESRNETEAAIGRAKQKLSDTERPEFDNSK